VCAPGYHMPHTGVVWYVQLRGECMMQAGGSSAHHSRPAQVCDAAAGGFQGIYKHAAALACSDTASAEGQATVVGPACMAVVLMVQA
jgi:hypothetical protein